MHCCGTSGNNFICLVKNSCIDLSLEVERDTEVLSITGAGELELVEFIEDYLRSDQLRKSEDGGMSHLLNIKDKIN